MRSSAALDAKLHCYYLFNRLTWRIQNVNSGSPEIMAFEDAL
jgi:hypothetical protein